jgi:hypothetical protein
MYYFVFSRSRNSDGSFTNNMHYKGASKTAAISVFETRVVNSFSITAVQEHVYFSGFNSDLTFVNELKTVDVLNMTNAHINTLLRNMPAATCTNTLAVSGYKPKCSVVLECEECDCTNTTVQKNVYGKYLCADCWATYLTSEEGLVEYYLGIANGAYSDDSFSAADLASIVSSWAANKNRLNKTAAEIALIEANYASAIK